MMYIGFVARILFASVFLVAAFSKARHRGTFVYTIRSIGFHKRLAQVMVWMVIVYETVLVVLFVSGIIPLLAVLGAFCLLALFAGISIRAARLSQDIPCACFGETGTRLGKQTLLRSILLAIPVLVYYFTAHSMNASWWPTSLETLIGLLSLTLAALLLTRWLLIVKTPTTLIRQRQTYERDLADAQVQAILTRLQKSDLQMQENIP